MQWLWLLRRDREVKLRRVVGRLQSCLLGYVVSVEHLVSPVGEAILFPLETVLSSFGIALGQVHSTPSGNLTGVEIWVGEFTTAKNYHIDVLNRLVVTSCLKQVLAIFLALNARLRDDNVLNRALLHHDWLSVVLDSVLLGFDHASVIVGGMGIRHFDHRSVTHVGLSLRRSSCFQCGVCRNHTFSFYILLEPQSDFVKVEAVEERLLTLGHLLPVDTVQADTFIWLEINASSLLLGIF